MCWMIIVMLSMSVRSVNIIIVLQIILCGIRVTLFCSLRQCDMCRDIIVLQSAFMRYVQVS